MKKTQMKYLFSILGLTFLSLTLTNCSLSPQKIASQLEASVVLLSYRNQSGHGTGFFVDGKPGVCSVLTACLLYTSPSPRDSRRSRMPSSA